MCKNPEVAEDNLGLSKIDQSISSMINTLIVRCGGSELERLEEYGRIHSMLSDIWLGPEKRKSLTNELYSFGSDDIDLVTFGDMLNSTNPAN